MHLRLPGPHSPSWVLAESVAGAAFSLLSMVLVGRAIGPHAAGLGTVAIAAFMLLDLLGAMMFPDALVQRARLEPRHADSAATASVLAGAAAGLVLAGAGPALAAGFGEPALAPMAWVLAALLPLSAFSGTASGLLLREHRFRLLALRLLVGQPLALAAGLAAALAGLGAWAMVAVQAVATLVTFALMLHGALRRHRLRPRLDAAALRDLWPVAGPQLAGVTVNAGRYRVFLLALGLLVAEQVLAMSHFAFRLLDSVLAVVWQTVGRIGVPRLCALQHDRAALAEAYGDLAQLQALLAFPICAGVALTAPDIVRVLLGPAWAGTGEATRIVALAAAAAFAHGDAAALFVALGKARRNLAAALATLAVSLGALALLRPQTPEGAAAVWSAQCVLVPPVLAWLVLRDLRRGPLWLARRVAPAALATAAMAVAVLSLRAALPPLAPPALLLASAGTGAAVYAGVAWLLLGRRPPRALLASAPAAAPA